MNLYIIVEGRRTEKKVYPEWFNFLIPELNRVNWAFEATHNNYFLFNGNVFHSLLHNFLYGTGFLYTELDPLQSARLPFP